MGYVFLVALAVAGLGLGYALQGHVWSGAALLFIGSVTIMAGIVDEFQARYQEWAKATQDPEER